jgi:hypothetical protein
MMILRRDIIAVLASLVLTHKSMADENTIRSLSRLIENLRNISGQVKAIGRSVYVQRQLQDLGVLGPDKAKEVAHYQTLTISNYDRVALLFNDLVQRIVFDLDHTKSDVSVSWYEESERNIDAAYQALVDSYRKAGIDDQVSINFLTGAGKVVLEVLAGLTAEEVGKMIADLMHESYKSDAVEQLKHINLAPYSSFSQKIIDPETGR